jgi:hypothetical protein
MQFLRLWLVAVLFVGTLPCPAQERHKVIINQDAAGPAGTDQQSILLLGATGISVRPMSLSMGAATSMAMGVMKSPRTHLTRTPKPIP